MSAFTPGSAALGGALIGLSAVLLMLLNGRQAGISGIFGDLFIFRRSEFGWEIAFLAGLVAAPWLMHLAGFSLPHPAMPASWGIILVGGLLVGFGTRWSGGCTSGHGVCGIARLSTRSIAATCVFMAAAIVTVAITRHVIGA
jgi:uncharacterized membrane protein YedE/YeeE